MALQRRERRARAPADVGAPAAEALDGGALCVAGAPNAELVPERAEHTLSADAAAVVDRASGTPVTEFDVRTDAEALACLLYTSPSPRD